MIRFRCPACRNRHQVSPSRSGEVVLCSDCGARIMVPLKVRITKIFTRPRLTYLRIRLTGSLLIIATALLWIGLIAFNLGSASIGMYFTAGSLFVLAMLFLFNLMIETRYRGRRVFPPGRSR